MPNWRRMLVAGGTYFFTVVTDQRMPIFSEERPRRLLGEVMRECRTVRPFQTMAIVLLPDHLHAIWSLPRGDHAYSWRWAWIKKEFAKRWLALGGRQRWPTAGMTRDGRRGVWQAKFWEHVLRSETDLERHADYIHYNPVKHGLAESPAAWAWSSFHRWVREGHYPPDWGRAGLPFAAIDRLNRMSATTGE